MPDFAISCTFYFEMNSQFFLLSYPQGSPQWLLCYLLLKGSQLKTQISMQCRIISIQATNFLYKCLQCFMHSAIFRAEEMNFFSFILLPFNTTCAQKNTGQFTLFTYQKNIAHTAIIKPLARFQIKLIPIKHILFVVLVDLSKKMPFRI